MGLTQPHIDFTPNRVPSTQPRAVRRGQQLLLFITKPLTREMERAQVAHGYEIDKACSVFGGAPRLHPAHTINSLLPSPSTINLALYQPHSRILIIILQYDGS